MIRVIEGRWDDLIRRDDLRGRKVRIQVLDDARVVQDDSWLKALLAWADGHKHITHYVDDSRDGIYSGTVDDPR